MNRPNHIAMAFVRRWSWAPIPLLLAAMVACRAAGLRGSCELASLRLVLSFMFYTLVSLGTLVLIGRSFLAQGKPGLLLLECGVVLWSLAGTLGDAVSHGDANINATIFNTGILLAGLCHLGSAVLALRPQRSLRSRTLWLAAGWALALAALWLVTHAARARWLPVFFVTGLGGTPVRHCVLLAAISLFVLSAGLVHAGQRTARTPFAFWYALALLLLAVGLFGIMIQWSIGSAVNWLGRTAQWLGGVYLLLAALAALRALDLPLLPTVDKPRPAYYRSAMAAVMVLAAAAMRLAFLSAMGTRAPYIVFYPAIVFAALYGGWRTGLLATALAASLAAFFWIPSNGPFAFAEPADWLGLAIFLLSGAMVAWIADALHRARARAAAAETQALLAAEREAAAEALRASDARYRDLFEAMTEGFSLDEIICDEAGRPCDLRYLAVNPAFERHTGLKAADIVGRTVRELFPNAEPEWFERYGKVALTGEPAHFEAEFGPLGRWFAVASYRTEPGRFAVLFVDITDRKRAEVAAREGQARLRQSQNRLNLALTSSRMATFDWDILADKRIWDENVHHLLGTTPETFTGTAAEFFRVIHPDDRPAVQAALTTALESGVYETEYRACWPNGTIRYISARGLIHRNEAGRPVRMTGIVWDSTARKQTEEQLRASLQEKEVLLKEVHHRVKNNMQVISSLVNLQAEALDNPAARELFGGIRDQIRAMALVHEKLYRSDNLAGVDFAGYARSLLEYLWRAHGAAAAGVRVQFDLQPVTLAVEDAAPCGLILNELAVNTLKHAFRGRPGGEVTVALRRETDGQVRLVVRDNGVGLPAGVDWRQSRSLGLRLVVLLAGQLNGTVEARSGGDGTEFTVKF